jgi:hypothetical protein
MRPRPGYQKTQNTGSATSNSSQSPVVMCRGPAHAGLAGLFAGGDDTNFEPVGPAPLSPQTLLFSKKFIPGFNKFLSIGKSGNEKIRAIAIQNNVEFFATIRKPLGSVGIRKSINFIPEIHFVFLPHVLLIPILYTLFLNVKKKVNKNLVDKKNILCL